jgi:AcrR family transcriptional regulator
VPRLWNDTIEEHRRAVRDAILDATARLAAENGLTAVTMSDIAAASGIGRATLYKYFPDVETIMMAWHERAVTYHLDQLSELSGGDPGQRVRATLERYAFMQYEHQRNRLTALLHQGEHMVRARRRLRDFLAGLLADAAVGGQVRRDIPPGELAEYCLHALGAAAALSSKPAVRRLVTVTWAGVTGDRDIG